MGRIRSARVIRDLLAASPPKGRQPWRLQDELRPLGWQQLRELIESGWILPVDRRHLENVTEGLESDPSG